MPIEGMPASGGKTNDRETIRPASIFISYSHKDQHLIEPLEEHLANLKHQGVISTWHDRQIEAGREREGAISEQLDSARIILLLISPSFMASDDCYDVVMKRALQRHRDGEARVIPVILRPVDWRSAELGSLQAIPRNGKAVTSWRNRDNAFAEIAKELREIILGPAPGAANPPPGPFMPGTGVSPPRATDATDSERAFLSMVVSTSAMEYGKASLESLLDPLRHETPYLHRKWDDEARGDDRKPGHFIDPSKVSISRLPIFEGAFVNRTRELERLDEIWDEGARNVVSIVGFGGEGKTDLVVRWLGRLARSGFRGGERVYAWSFYAKEAAGIEAKDFIASSLQWFGDNDPLEGDEFKQGERLATLINRERTLLILDGLEALQYPPKHPWEGQIKSNALRVLIANLAYMNRGLCVITTRLSVAGLMDFELLGLTERIPLNRLSPSVGARLLRKLGVKGENKELMLASEEYAGHCLSLNLLGSYLASTSERLVDRRGELLTQGSPSERVLKSYERWMGEGPQLSILRMLAFFDRPAVESAIATLRSPPVIKGLNESVVEIHEAEWQETLSALQRANLIMIGKSETSTASKLVEQGGQPPSSGEETTLDAHPLVKEYFRLKLMQNAPEAWREGARRLYRYFSGIAPEYPESHRDMQPLFQSVVYACQAGYYKEALNQIYLTRIMRGNQFYAANRFGLIRPLLDVLSHFFEKGNWHLPASKGTGRRGQTLGKVDQLTLLIQAGTLLSVGRGYADSEVEKVFRRAQQLLGSLRTRKETPQLFSVMWGLWTFSTVRGNLDGAHVIASELVRIARNVDEPWHLLLSYRMMGDSEFWKGNFGAVEQFLTKAVRLYKRLAGRPGNAETPPFAEDPGVMSLGYLGYSQWFQGRIKASHETSDAAVELARELDQPYTLCYAKLHRTVLHQLDGNAPETLEWANRTLELATRYGFAFQVELAWIWMGWAIFRNASSIGDMKEAREGVLIMKNHLKSYRAMGCGILIPHLGCLLSEGLQALGQTDQALHLLDEALEKIQVNHERYYEPEVWRLRGRIVNSRRKVGQEPVVTDFQRAIESAKSLGARTFQKRASDELRLNGESPSRS